MRRDVMISSQFNGPPKSANGGYASGVLASALTGAGYTGAVEVSLHVPPPLDKSLLLEGDGQSAALMDGDIKVGTAKAAKLCLEIPDLPHSPVLVGKPHNPEGGFEPFDICFVCGDARDHGDGLCLQAERIEGFDGLVAAPWDIHPSFVDEDGTVRAEFIWSALDCPGYFACAYGEAALLARFVVEVIKPLKGNKPAHVFGWSLDDQSSKAGRKRKCGTAVVDADGTVVAKAEALWIIVDPAKIAA